MPTSVRMTSKSDRITSMLWGALVADTAAMGLHWLYDQRRIADVAGDAPEFRTPTKSDYESVPSYFAHPTRAAGEPSQYGEQMRCMMTALADGAGYTRGAYRAAFADQFGYGGTFVGYIDRPTRGCLDKMAQQDNAIRTRLAKAVPETDPAILDALVTKTRALSGVPSGDTLAREIKSLLAAEPMVSIADTASILADAVAPPGIEDNQLPALAKLPPLIARHLDDPDLPALVQDAVCVTNNSTQALAFAAFAMHLLKAVLNDGILPDLAKLAEEAGPDVFAAVQPVLLRQDERSEGIAQDVGMACYLTSGVPVICHILMTAPTFVDAVRTNIRAGGDSCGRAILLGAVLGAIHGIDTAKGIPANWINQLSLKTLLEPAIASL